MLCCHLRLENSTENGGYSSGYIIKSLKYGQRPKAFGRSREKVETDSSGDSAIKAKTCIEADPSKGKHNELFGVNIKILTNWKRNWDGTPRLRYTCNSLVFGKN